MLRIVARLQSRNVREKARRVRELKLYKTIRCYSKDLCPPPSKKKPGGSGGVYTLGVLALAAGGTLAYAKYDDDFRRTLTDAAPFTDDIIKFVFQEEGGGFLYVLSGIYEGVKRGLGNMMASDTSNRGGKKEYIEEAKEYKAPTPVIPIIEKDTKKPDEKYDEVRLDEKGKSEPEIVGEPKPVEKSLPETHPSNLAELEEQICAAATEAVNAYNKAIYNLKVYNQELDAIIDDAVDHIKPENWESVRAKTREKNESIQVAKQKADNATKLVNKLKELISRPDFEGSTPATKEMIMLNIKKVQEDIAEAKKQFEMEQRLGSVAERYWDKVDKARKHFAEELETLFPSINLSSKQLHVDPSELDLFLLHCYANVMFYQKELAKMETLGHERLQLAVEAARRGGGEPLTNAQICEALEEEKRRLTVCFQQQCLKLRKESEAELREQLKRQSQIFTDHLDEAVRTRAAEIERDLTRKFDEQLEAEKARYKMQLAAMIGRLRGLDRAIKVRDDADKTAKQSQVLWSACQALLRAIQTGCPGIPWQDQLRPLEPEITTVEKAAAKGDELVEAVINGIPPEARDRGIFPEDALRERFLKVEEVARNLALVPEDGGALPLFILSYLQSLLLIKSASPIPQAELNDEATDFSKLSTNEILQRARYWLDRGNFEQTLKYMNLLRGAPRSVARQWMNEARILLETEQAANTLMAHAASSGLMYL